MLVDDNDPIDGGVDDRTEPRSRVANVGGAGLYLRLEGFVQPLQFVGPELPSGGVPFESSEEPSEHSGSPNDDSERDPLEPRDRREDGSGRHGGNQERRAQGQLQKECTGGLSILAQIDSFLGIFGETPAAAAGYVRNRAFGYN